MNIHSAWRIFVPSILLSFHLNLSAKLSRALLISAAPFPKSLSLTIKESASLFAEYGYSLYPTPATGSADFDHERTSLGSPM